VGGRGYWPAAPPVTKLPLDLCDREGNTVPPMRRRGALLALPSLLTAGPGGPAARAAEWPTRPVRILVGFAPGGFTDILARAIAPALSARFGPPFVVENRPGAAGVLAAEAVAKAPPDGHTLLLAHPTAVSIAPALAQRLPFDAAAAFAPVTLLAMQPHLLIVKRDSPWRGVQDLVADARARPGAVTYGSSGVGSVQHVAGEVFAAATGAEFTHVPYRGSAPTMADIAAGQVGFAIDGVAVSAPMIEAGQLRALAASVERRVARFPDVPTLAEAGVPGVAIGSWFGLIAPAGTPPAVVEALRGAAVQALEGPEALRVLRAASAEPVGSTPAEFAAFIAAETARYRRLSARTRITLD
jgi:tripartite-type tricarboxylate transporter receptor subunit TctC